jgi:hypothetical protein
VRPGVVDVVGEDAAHRVREEVPEEQMAVDEVAPGLQTQRDAARGGRRGCPRARRRVEPALSTTPPFEICGFYCCVLELRSVATIYRTSDRSYIPSTSPVQICFLLILQKDYFHIKILHVG